MATKILFQLEAQNKKFNDALNEASKKTENLEKNIAAVGKVGAVAFAGIAGAIGANVKQASKIEDIVTQFEVLTGSVNGATKAVEQLQEFSADTPFQFEQVAQAGKQLLAFGFEVDQITEKLNEIGDVAAASGKDVGELTTVYGQVAAAGKLTGERLNQLQEAAVPINAALAKALGVTESSVRDLVSKGAVDFATFEKAFKSLSQEGGFAFGGLEKASQTLSGKISTLEGNFQLVSAEIGKAFLPALKQAADSLIGFLTEIRKNPALVEQAQQFLKAGLVIGGTVTAVTALTLGFIKLISVAAGVAAILRGISLPIIAIKGAVVALIASVGLLVAGWDSNLSIIDNLTTNFATRISTIFSGLKSVISGALSLDTNEVKEGLEQIKAAFSTTLDDVETKRDEIESRRAERIQKEIDDNKALQERLLAEEQAANEKRAQLKAEQNQLALQGIEDQAALELEAKAQIALLEQEQNAQFSDQEKEQLTKFLGDKESLQLTSAKRLLAARKQRAEQEMEIERRFGTEYLKFWKVTNSEQFQSFEGLARDTQNLQQSSNKTLKGLGKAAAITDIGIQSSKGAMAAFAQAVAAFPPPVGPIVGGALAAAQLAYGAQRISQVRGAKDGALVEGKMGGDVNPFMLERGELVTPRKNFDDVVKDAATRQIESEQGDERGGLKEVIIGFTEDAFEIIEQKLLERRALGVGSL